MFPYKGRSLPHTEVTVVCSVDRRHICLQKKKLEPISCLPLGGPSDRIFNQRNVRRMICLFVLNCPAGLAWLAIINISQSASPAAGV